MTITSSSSAPNSPRVLNTPLHSARQNTSQIEVELPLQLVPLMMGIQFIQHDTAKIRECRDEMERERGRLEAELRDGPPEVDAPIFWLENSPSKPIKTAMKLFIEKRKELAARVPIQWRRDLDNQAEERLHNFEMRGHQLYREPIEKLVSHEKEVLEQLKFPDEIEEIERYTNGITDEVVNCINTLEKNWPRFQSLPEQERSAISNLYTKYVVSHDVHQKAQAIMSKLRTINSEMISYQNALLAQADRARRLKNISQVSSAKDLLEEMDAQAATLNAMKRKNKSALRYIDKIDINTLLRIHSFNELYSSVVDLADEIEVLENRSKRK